MKRNIVGLMFLVATIFPISGGNRKWGMKHRKERTITNRELRLTTKPHRDRPTTNQKKMYLLGPGVCTGMLGGLALACLLTYVTVNTVPEYQYS